MTQRQMEKSTEWECVEYIDPYEWEMADRCMPHDQEHQDKDTEHSDTEYKDVEDKDMKDGTAEERNVENKSAEDENLKEGCTEAEDALLVEEAMLIEVEYRVELLRPPVNARVSMDQENDLPQSLPAFRLQGGHEKGLKSDPFVVKISGLAGYSHLVSGNTDSGIVTAAGTHQHRASATNPYVPFLSKLDWEVARWVKLRGPGSMAVTKLMGIEGVSQLLPIEVQ